MKLFVGLSISDAVAERLQSCAKELSDLSLGNYVACRAKDMHITLKYIGEGNPHIVKQRLDHVSSGRFSIDIAGCGAFEHVAWAKPVDICDNLGKLKRKIDEALEGICSVENRPYIPHVTLAYKKNLSLENHDIPIERFEECFSRFCLYRIVDESFIPEFVEIASWSLHEAVTVACVNDFHATMDNAPRLVAALEEFKRQNPASLVVFGGDNYFGDPVCDLLEGRPVSEMMQLLDVPFSAIGNHDYDYGSQTLEAWARDGRYEFLCANIEGFPSFAKPYGLVEVNGRKIGFIGLATCDDMPSPETPRSMYAYGLTDPAVAMCGAFEKIRNEKPDVVIALAHLGLKSTDEGELVGHEVEAVCNACPRLDGMFAAHWHRFVSGFINGVPVSEGGGNGRGFSILNIVFLDGNILVEPSFVQIEAGEQDPRMLALWEGAIAETENRMRETLFSLDIDIPNRDMSTAIVPLEGSPFSTLAANIVLEHADCDAVLLYSGRLGSGFHTGTISRYDFEKTLMFENNLFELKVTGAMLRRNIELGMRLLATEGSSPVAVAGLDVEIDPSHPVGQRVISLAFPDGRSFDDNASYTIVADEFLCSGAMGYTLDEACVGAHRLDKTLKQLIEEYLKRLRHADGMNLEEMLRSWVRRRTECR